MFSTPTTTYTYKAYPKFIMRKLITKHLLFWCLCLRHLLILWLIVWLDILRYRQSSFVLFVCLCSFRVQWFSANPNQFWVCVVYGMRYEWSEWVMRIELDCTHVVIVRWTSNTHNISAVAVKINMIFINVLQLYQQIDASVFSKHKQCYSNVSESQWIIGNIGFIRCGA